MNDRFDLEEAITNVFDINDELELLMYRIGDSPVSPTEDELMNMLIGIIELNKVRYEKLWNTFASLIEKEVITNKNVDNIEMPPYDDGTMKMEVTNSEGEIK